MSVELSRRIALLTTMPAMLEAQADGGYIAFLKDIESSDTFDDLEPSHQELIVKAEREAKK